MPTPIRPNATTPVTPQRAAQPAQPARAGAFAQALQEAQVKFSSHAQKRLEKRDITLSDEHLQRLNAAVSQVAEKGGRESLVLLDDLAFIVNVRERLVVTAIDRNSQRGGVFTQIDSVVLAGEPINNHP
jgi:flagellar operon protein